MRLSALTQRSLVKRVFSCRRLIALSLALLVAPVAYADTDTDIPLPMAQVMRRHGLSTAGLSLYAQVIGEREPFLAVAPDTPRNPASVMKLVTTLAALEELGPSYRWKTEVYGGRPPREGRLDGDLYLKGYGDPYLVIENFWRLTRGLRLTGLEQISGDLVLDQTHFSEEPGDPAEFDGQRLRAYNVLPRALLVNFQAIQIRLLPQGRGVRVVTDPPVDISNQLRLTRGACRGGAHRWSMRVREGKQPQLLFTGTYAGACGETELYRALSETGPYVHSVFANLWKEQGGRLLGRWRNGATPEDAALLYTYQSPPLGELIRLINKFSNNVMTRQLLMTLGAERFGAPGSSESGGRAVEQWLERRRMHFPELVLDNGAGLSRDARISARSLGRLLLAGHQSPYMPEFISALPISGQDGTLATRFSGDLAGRLHLKTGSLAGVRSLAGYVLDSSGRWVMLVFLYNDPRANSGAAEAAQRALIDWIYDGRTTQVVDTAPDDPSADPENKH